MTSSSTSLQANIDTPHGDPSTPSIDVNMPKGDGISVSLKAGRLHVSNSSTSDIQPTSTTSPPKDKQTGSTPIL